MEKNQVNRAWWPFCQVCNWCFSPIKPSKVIITPTPPSPPLNQFLLQNDHQILLQLLLLSNPVICLVGCNIKCNKRERCTYTYIFHLVVSNNSIAIVFIKCLCLLRTTSHRSRMWHFLFMLHHASSVSGSNLVLWWMPSELISNFNFATLSLNKNSMNFFLISQCYFSPYNCNSSLKWTKL